MRIILLGAPGAGKGTQAELISQHFNIPQISTGGILRAAVEQDCDLGRQVKAVMATGQLVSDTIMIDLIQARIAQTDCQAGFLLDGFPRTLPQAKALQQAGVRIDYVLEIAVPDEAIIQRMSGRLIHAASGRTYHTQCNPPKQNNRDDVTGETLEQREDDKPATVAKRLQIYHQQTEPLVQFYQEYAQKSALRCHSIDGLRAIKDVQAEAIHLLSLS